MVMRYEEELYMNTGTTSTPVWTRIGEGFTEAGVSFNGQTYTVKYISDKNERNYLVGYSPEIGFDANIYTNNPVMEKILDVIKQEKLGTDALCQIVIVDAYEWDGIGPNVAPARKRDWTIVPEGMSSGVEALLMNGAFQSAGETEFGTFNRDTQTFIPAP